MACAGEIELFLYLLLTFLVRMLNDGLDGRRKNWIVMIEDINAEEQDINAEEQCVKGLINK